MIGFLSGKLLEADLNTIIIDVSGVGYLVHPSASVLGKNLAVGEKIDLPVYTHVREDQITLFGFSSKGELDLFKQLLTVSGVGPKSAMTITGSGTVAEIKSAISNADVDFFQSIPGIGKKTSQRIIIDLKSKIGESKELDLSSAEIKQRKDLLSALKTMGITADEAKEIIKNVDANLPLQEQIKLVLKRL
ncbi:MAG: Holliday junction branch migration protein RuvA [Patescibacteria group bacterium]